MTDQHPITPPPELIEQWFQDWDWRDDGPPCNEAVAIRAARWGADMELEACCEHINQWFAAPEHRVAELRAARRPQPLSLAEEALDQLSSIQIDLTRCGMGISVETIRRALEHLKELEGQGQLTKESV